MPKPTKNIKWRGSKAREILLDNLCKNIIPLDNIELSAEQAWQQKYSVLPPFALVPFSQFKRQLKAHREQIRKKQNSQDSKVVSTESNSCKPIKKIKWLGSKARFTLLCDIEKGFISLTNEQTAEHLWNTRYSKQQEFASVPFEQFKTQLQAHRKQVEKKLKQAQEDNELYLWDAHYYPRKTNIIRGEPVFDSSPAHQLLIEDIKSSNHLGIRPSVFQQTRKEYLVFNKRKFKERIYQQIRYNKFINYLDWKDKQKCRNK